MPMIRLFTSKNHYWIHEKCTSLNVLPNVTNGVCLLGNTKPLSESSVAWDKRSRRYLKRLEVRRWIPYWHVWVDKQLDQEKPNEQNELGSESSFHFSKLVSRPQQWWPGCSAGDFSHINHTAWPAQCVLPHPWSAARVGRPSQRDPSEPRRASLPRRCATKFSAVKTRGGSLSLQSKLISESFRVKPFWQKLILW